MAKESLGHLFRYYRSCKNTSTLLLGERAYSTTGNSRVHYLKSGYVIQLIAFRWDTACIRSSPDPSLLLRKWVWLARLTSKLGERGGGGGGGARGEDFSLVIEIKGKRIQ